MKLFSIIKIILIFFIGLITGGIGMLYLLADYKDYKDGVKK